MKLREVPTGDRFRFLSGPDAGRTFEARGNGWYAAPGGYDGGPWIGVGPDGYTGSFDPEVEPAPLDGPGAWGVSAATELEAVLERLRALLEEENPDGAEDLATARAAGPDVLGGYLGWLGGACCLQGEMAHEAHLLLRVASEAEFAARRAAEDA